jgi:hypothetical protein
MKYCSRQVFQNHSANNIEHSIKTAAPSPIYLNGGDHFEIHEFTPQFNATRQGKIELPRFQKATTPESA